MSNTVHYKKGRTNLYAFVLSCPGKHERDAIPPGPAAGPTGDNLNYLICSLQSQNSNLNISRDNATITNSWPHVEFKSKGGTGRTEATLNEVMAQDNLERLAHELCKIEKYIFACGINAKEAVNALMVKKRLTHSVKVIELVHFGNQSINSIRIDNDGNEIVSYKNASEKPSSEKRPLKEISRENRFRRLNKIAFDLLAEMY